LFEKNTRKIYAKVRLREILIFRGSSRLELRPAGVRFCTPIVRGWTRRGLPLGRIFPGNQEGIEYAEHRGDMFILKD
jgi:hypothetical protein